MTSMKYSQPEKREVLELKHKQLVQLGDFSPIRVDIGLTITGPLQLVWKDKVVSKGAENVGIKMRKLKARALT
jgi:hypothetical protein